MRHLRTLIATACVILLSSAYAQNVPCPGEPLIFELEGEFYGTKIWEYSTDGVTWNAIQVVESEPFILQPEQSGWYRVRFHDEACNISYVSAAQRFVVHAIDLGDALTISIGGVVKNEWGMPVYNATVRGGCGEGVSTTTDHFGVFLLQGVVAYEGLAYVTVEKEGYFRGSRSFVPGENADEAISHAHITLLAKSIAGTVMSASGGQVQLDGLTISFPPDAFVQNGQPFNGRVNVALNHIDPTSDDLHEQMPGMLMGVMDEQPQQLYSFGMSGVELTDDAGNTVQLAPGSSATVRFTVLGSQLSTAPASIPLWWFDEDLGYWVGEGNAQLVGSEYVGEVAHFSWWNCDVPSNFVLLKGVVLDQGSGAILANTQIRLVSANMGTGISYTNGAGEFTGLVPINQVLTLQVWLPCGALGAQVLVHEETVGPYAALSAIMVLVEAPGLNLVTGHVLDCSTAPVEEGYVWANGQAVFCAEGAFEFVTCAASIGMRAVDLAAGNVSDHVTIELIADTMDVGDLVACTPTFGTVTDIDGNVYQTVIIGTQDWMAENLRTTRYHDGSIIPNVTDSVAWTQLSTGAWCNFDNNPGYDATRGKLYNWWVAANPFICPLGWHVPTDAEWTILTDYLGGHLVAGGKVKAVSPLWLQPNNGATNESGFSGIPGGYRYHYQGIFMGLSTSGRWWSATEDWTQERAFYRSLNSGNAVVTRYGEYKRDGNCLRCVRD